MSENFLHRETSPYLLQHKDNPVHWRAWGPEALEEAKRTGKPILLSIGYAACHWCHVMEHESFEDEEVAEILNISKAFAYKLMQTSQLTTICIGSSRRVRITDLEDFIFRNTQPQGSQFGLK